MNKPHTHRPDSRIKTWRAPEPSANSSVLEKQKVNQTSAPAPSLSAKVAGTAAPIVEPGAPSSPIKRILVAPSASQLDVLNSIFEGPKTLLHLLRLYPEQITSIGDASRFLDKYMRRLAPLLLKRGNGQGVKRLESLIWEWSRELPGYVSFALPSSCWISEWQDIILPIPELEVLAPKDKEAVGRLRRGRRYWTDFVLVSIGSSYWVDVEFVSGSMSTEPKAAQSTKHVASKPSQAKPRASDRAQPRFKAIPLQEYLNYFDNLVLQKLRHELEVSRQFSTTRFAELSGRAVSGGLPSLPRRP